MNKKWCRSILLLVASMLCTLLCSCGSGIVEQDKSQAAKTMLQADSPNQIAEKLLQTAVSSDKMVKLQNSQIPFYYDFDISLINDASIYTSKVDSVADEVAVFQLRQEENSNTVVQAVNERVNVRAKSFKQLSPAEYEKFNNVIVEDKSGYVILVVCGKPDTARNTIAEFYTTVKN